MRKRYVVLATAVVAFLFLIFHHALAAGSININTASLAELDDIVGIGPALAQRIIDARPFGSLDDLLRVKGIGPKTLQKIKDQGLAQVSGDTILMEEPAFTKSSGEARELPNEEKSDTKVSVAAAGEKINSVSPTRELFMNSWNLTLVTIGFMLISSAALLFKKNK